LHSKAGTVLGDPIRYRYNTMAPDTPGGEWKWRIVLEGADGFEEILVNNLIVNVPSFSREDDMPVAGRKYHMACYGRLHVENDIGIIDAAILNIQQ
jgi:hypothetical protein